MKIDTVSCGEKQPNQRMVRHTKKEKEQLQLMATKKAAKGGAKKGGAKKGGAKKGGAKKGGAKKR
jgi:hypothetical protein